MNKTISSLLVVIILVAGGYYLSIRPPQDSMQPVEIDQMSTTNTEDSTINEHTGTTIIYTETGFTPKTLTVTKGTTVTFVNSTTKKMWIGADEHPTHTEYDGTSKNDHCPNTDGTAFDQCETGDVYTFTFNKVGAWDYHNHTSASDEGTIVVTE